MVEEKGNLVLHEHEFEDIAGRVASLFRPLLREDYKHCEDKIRESVLLILTESSVEE